MWALALAALLVSASPEVTLRTLDGRTVVGELQSLGDGKVVVKAKDGEVTADLQQVIDLRPASAPPKPGEISAWVQLTDGSRLAGTQYVVDKTKAKFILNSKAVEVSAMQVAIVQFREPTPTIAAQWQEILTTKVAGDLVVMRKGESIDYLEGALGDITIDSVKFEVEGKVVDIKRDRVEGLVYLRNVADTPDPLCSIADSEGSVWRARSVSWKSDSLEVETISGLKASIPWTKTVAVDFSAGKIQYLADLTPDALKVATWISQNVPALIQWRHPRSNQWGKRGGEVIPLKLRGQVYERGLALRSRTELTYRLRGKYRKFMAIAGIDDEVEGLGHVRLVIEADSKTVFDEPIRGADPAREIEIDISGVNVLKILVDFGEGGDTSDFLDLCEARVTK